MAHYSENLSSLYETPMPASESSEMLLIVSVLDKSSSP